MLRRREDVFQPFVVVHSEKSPRPTSSDGAKTQKEVHTQRQMANKCHQLIRRKAKKKYGNRTSRRNFNSSSETFFESHDSLVSNSNQEMNSRLFIYLLVRRRAILSFALFRNSLFDRSECSNRNRNLLTLTDANGENSLFSESHSNVLNYHRDIPLRRSSCLCFPSRPWRQHQAT